MRRFKVLRDFNAMGTTVTPDGTEATTQARQGVFHTGEIIEGEIVPAGSGWMSHRGYNFMNQGVYWQVDPANLEPDPSQGPITAAEKGDINPNNGNPNTPLPISTGTQLITSNGLNIAALKDKHWPKFVGAGIVGLISYKIGQKIFPGTIGTIIFVGAGLLAGYYGTDKLLKKYS